MEPLKLIALDSDDLAVVSAHVQDAVLKVGDLQYLVAAKNFVVPMNRFAWETASGLLSQHNERRNSVLQFGRVLSVRSSNVTRDRPKEILSLLAVRFEPSAEPAGTIELVFAGDGTIRLDVECIEVRLADLGGAWQASSRPRHKA